MVAATDNEKKLSETFLVREPEKSWRWSVQGGVWAFTSQDSWRET